YATFTGGEIILAVRVAGPGMFQLQDKNGAVRPGHATAVGKVILASLPEAERRRYYNSHPFIALTDKTIQEEAALEAELARVTADGFAYDDGEYNSEARCVAAPVRDFSGKVVGAVGISGPIWHMNLQRMAEITQHVASAATKLSDALGG
ncbi:MAG: transcriptional regulator KdgR, partial [Burkholderia sp.]|nr:transcriptional regulator KdgR [Burkholderia sp.]